MGAVRSVFELAKINSGPAPARRTLGKHQKLVARMNRGDWVLVSRARAKQLVEAARLMDGRAISYAVSGHQSCVKVLEAPWGGK